MAPASSLAGFPPAFRRRTSSFSFPRFEESLSMLFALVTYLRTWVDSWVATQPLATKKMNAKAMTRSKMEPSSVSQAGSALSRRFLGRRGEDRPEGLVRRDFEPALWDLRSMRNPPSSVGEGGLEPPRPLGH